MTDEQRQSIKQQIDYMVSLVPNGETCGFNPQIVAYMTLFSNFDEVNKLWTVDDGTKTIKVRSNA